VARQLLLARNSAAAEKRGRAKIPSPRPPSFLPARAIEFQILKFRIRIFVKISSDFNQKVPPFYDFVIFRRYCLALATFLL